MAFLVSPVSSLECRMNKINPLPAHIQLKFLWKKIKSKRNINVMPNKARYQFNNNNRHINSKQCQCSNGLRIFGLGYTQIWNWVDGQIWFYLKWFFKRCHCCFVVSFYFCTHFHDYGHRNNTNKLFICSLFISSICFEMALRTWNQFDANCFFFAVVMFCFLLCWFLHFAINSNGHLKR